MLQKTFTYFLPQLVLGFHRASWTNLAWFSHFFSLAFLLYRPHLQKLLHERFLSCKPAPTAFSMQTTGNSFPPGGATIIAHERMSKPRILQKF